jgi:hypothetical protein
MRDPGQTPAAERGADVVLAPRADGPSRLGTDGHVRLTLDRVSHLLADARSRQTRAEALQSRTDAALATSQRAVHEPAAVEAALRASVTAYVQRLHDEHVPPQRMLVLVKDAVREAVAADTDVLERRALMACVVRWSIEAYYAA